MDVLVQMMNLNGLLIVLDLKMIIIQLVKILKIILKHKHKYIYYIYIIQVDELYRKPAEWAKCSILNSIRSFKFSSDRTI